MMEHPTHFSQVVLFSLFRYDISLKMGKALHLKTNKKTKKPKTTHQKQKQKKPTLNSFYPLEYICQVEIGPGIMNVKSLHATKTMTDNREKNHHDAEMLT